MACGASGAVCCSGGCLRQRNGSFLYLFSGRDESGTGWNGPLGQPCVNNERARLLGTIRVPAAHLRYPRVEGCGFS